MNDSPPTILITIDVEDWFQVENFKDWIPFSSWPSYELRVEKNTHKLLNLLDSIELKAQSSKLKESNDSTKGSGNPINRDNETNHGDIEDFRRRRIVLDHFHPESEPGKNKSPKSCQTKNNKIESNPRSSYALSAMSYELSHDSRPKATFFVLGWIAERLPNLVREISSRGHEVASHGFYHDLCQDQCFLEFEEDLMKSKKLLEDITGEPVCGYRAPSFSIDTDFLKVIEHTGYLYDSSYNSFSMHNRYGQISFDGDGKKGLAQKITENFCELPISNVNFNGTTLPLGGGGYFRLIPFLIFKAGVKTILEKENAYLFYTHPWEFDPEQPKMNDASTTCKFRHYTNLRKTELKLKKLIESFNYCRFFTCSQYLCQIMSEN